MGKRTLQQYLMAVISYSLDKAKEAKAKLMATLIMKCGIVGLLYVADQSLISHYTCQALPSHE